MAPTGSLSGQITLEGTANPEGIMVYLLGTNYVAMTDDQGNFTFTGVPVGTYALMATLVPVKHVSVIIQRSFLPA